MEQSIKLSELPAGQSGIISRIPSGRSALTRLREMGLVPGARVTIVRRAPLGEPVEISVHGSRLAMRNHEASFIELAASA